MRIRRPIRFLLLLLAPLLALPLAASITEEGMGIVFGADHAFKLKAPKGWVLDNESAVNEGVHAVFYPKGSNWADSEVVAYARSRPRTKEIVTVEDTVKALLDDFHANGSPKYQGKKIKSIKTDAGKEAVIYHFSGDQWGNSEAVAYFVEDKTINFLVLTSRDPKSFAAALPAFENLAKSYVFMGDHPMNDSKPAQDSSKKP